MTRRRRPPPVPVTRRAVAYLRFSPQRDAHLSESIETQRAAVLRYAEARGLDLTEEDMIAESATSASAPLAQRPGGAHLLDLLGGGTVGHVLVTTHDRLFRSTIDALGYLKAWVERRIALHILNLGGQAFDGSTPTGQLFLTQLFAFAEFERQMISARTRTGMRSRQERGQRMGSRCPYGWEPDPTSLHVTRHGAKPNGMRECTGALAVIQTVHSLRAEGLSYRAIAGHLEAAGVPPPDGKRWYPGTVRRIAARLPTTTMPTEAQTSPTA